MDIRHQFLRLFEKRPAVFACLSAAAVRLVWCAIALTGTFFQVHPERFWHVSPAGRGYFFTPWQALDMACRWDGIYYLHIAEHGYACAPDYLCTAFFPLFPLLVAVVHAITPVPLYLCALGVANTADVLGWVLLAHWCQRRLPPQTACWAFCAFLVFPTRNFGFSVYTEGLFLTLSVAAFLAYESRRFALSSLLCALVSAVRPQGIFVGAALAVDALGARWRQAPWPQMAPSKAALAGLLVLPPVGLLAYMGYLMQQFGRPFLFMEVQRVWHRRWAAPWHIIGVHADPLEYVTLLGAIAVLILMLRRRAPLRDCVYVALSLLAPMSTARLTSINRFVGVLFPLFAFAAVHRPRRAGCQLYWATAVIYVCVFAFKLGQGAKVI